MENSPALFESQKKVGNDLLKTALTSENLSLQDFERYVLSALDNFSRAPIYDKTKINDKRCSMINNNKSVAYLHLVKKFEVENQVKFETYIKKFIES